MFRRLIRNRRGAATVELALATPVLLLILFGIFQFSFLFFIQTHMVNAAREAARRMAVADLTTAQGEIVAESLLLIVGEPYTVNAIENADSVAVVIEIPVADVSVFPGFAEMFSGVTLNATVVMRKEGS